MDDYRELERMLHQELDKITRKGDLSVNELENATKVVCLLEKLAKLEESEMSNEGGYSERRYSMNIPSHSMPYYRSDSYDMYPRGTYSENDRGYSGHSTKDVMVKRLMLMKEEAPSEHERMIISEAIEKLER